MTPRHKIYTGNYPGSSSGYDSNVPLGFNKWDEQEYEPSPDEENEIEEREIDYWSGFDGEGITVENKGQFNCQND